MHIYFSGIGGTAIGPLALIAKQAGYEVSGSDKQDSEYVHYLREKGISDIVIGQNQEGISKAHAEHPIDWLVYSSAIVIENPDSPELAFCRDHNIKTSKRDELLNHIIKDKNLRLIATAGTHGKTTTTAMIVWLFKQLDLPVSYSVGAKISFGEMGEYEESSEYFVYECDEFDRNFLAFHPHLSIITGIDWDHPDVFPTRENYEAAFRKFISQSESAIFWDKDFAKLDLKSNEHYVVLDHDDPLVGRISLPGAVNRQDGWLAVQALYKLTDTPIEHLIQTINAFPGLARRFEEIKPGLYSDYAHTPPKIRGALQLAHEVGGDNVVIVYEGLHNTRQHFIKDELVHLFDGVKKLYVVPSYLAREDPKLSLLKPEDMIKMLNDKEHAEVMQLDEKLQRIIQSHLTDGDLVLALSAGGGGSLDEWLRSKF